jgi:hypothetical protein
MINTAKTAATATPAVEIWLPDVELEEGRTVEVGAGVLVVVAMRVEVGVLELVGEGELLLEEEDVEVMELDAVDEVEVMVDAAALSVELEAAAVDLIVEEAVDMAVDVAFAEVVEGMDEVVVWALLVELAVSLVEVGVLFKALSIWLLMLLASLTAALIMLPRRWKAIMISSAIDGRGP